MGFIYIAEHIQSNTFSVEYCPTEDMLTVFFTKPLQGKLFLKLCNCIIGVEYADGDQHAQRSVLDENKNEVTSDSEHVGPVGAISEE